MSHPMNILPPRLWVSVAFVVILCWSGDLHSQPPVDPPASQEPPPSPSVAPVSPENTDSFEQKMRLLEAAWKNRDFRLARALTHSLRDTIIQSQLNDELPRESLIPSSEFGTIASLPAPWQQWFAGWKYFKAINIREPMGQARQGEPVEIVLSFPEKQVQSLSREIRVIQIKEGKLKELPSQVFNEVRRGDTRSCHVLCQIDSAPQQQQTILILYGNPDAELPQYPSDLTTQGEGVALRIENAHFKADLSRHTGQLERLTLKREHGLELFSGGEGHGEPPGIDWAHDYVGDGGFQKFRISLWDTCPDYEVVRGPICTIVRRWGFPYSPVHPIFSPSRLNVQVEYRFYSGLPWFHKLGRMQAVADFRAEALRDDEWVFSGQSFTDKLWMDQAGKLHTGDVDSEHQQDLWGVGFYHRVSRDSFIALFLEHTSEGIPALKHTGEPTLFYRWHGHVWSRYPLPVQQVPQGANLYQKNAYVAIPFTYPDNVGEIESLRAQLTTPLVAQSGTLETPETTLENLGRLARPGEASDSTIPKSLIWDALRDCKDAQLYTADISAVDLGLIYDVRVRADVVTVVMAMPHRGRSLSGYFTQGSISVHPTFSMPIRERLLKIPGVRQVVVEQTWYPEWNSNRLTDLGRQKLGLSPANP